MVNRMSKEIKNEISGAWSRYLDDQRKRYNKNEGSTTQYEETRNTFKEGITNHRRLSRQEKEELLLKLGLPPVV